MLQPLHSLLLLLVRFQGSKPAPDLERREHVGLPAPTGKIVTAQPKDENLAEFVSVLEPPLGLMMCIIYIIMPFIFV